MTSFEVHHPELVIVGQHVLELNVPIPGADPTLGEQQVDIALIHVTRLEPILPGTAPSANGNGADKA
jgi:hypothetical protein